MNGSAKDSSAQEVLHTFAVFCPSPSSNGDNSCRRPTSSTLLHSLGSVISNHWRHTRQAVALSFVGKRSIMLDKTSGIAIVGGPVPRKVGVGSCIFDPLVTRHTLHNVDIRLLNHVHVKVGHVKSRYAGALRR